MFGCEAGARMPGLHFHHDQFLGMAGHKIHLPPRVAIVSHENFQPGPLKESGGYLLPVPTGFPAMPPGRTGSAIPRVKMIGDGAGKGRDPPRHGGEPPYRSHDFDPNHI